MYKYTTSGYSASAAKSESDIRFTKVWDPGAMVEADHSIFNKIIALSEENCYSCFGSSTGPETLTFGTFVVPVFEGDEWMDPFGEAFTVKALQIVVAKQIQYIKSIGGVMTGYSIVDDKTGVSAPPKALNISWNVGGMHHFARFELCVNWRGCVGYYDLMYNDSRAININHMNTSFAVVVEDAK